MLPPASRAAAKSRQIATLALETGMSISTVGANERFARCSTASASRTKASSYYRRQPRTICVFLDSRFRTKVQDVFLGFDSFTEKSTKITTCPFVS
jgi:hypothetical protein